MVDNEYSVQQNEISIQALHMNSETMSNSCFNSILPFQKRAITICNLKITVVTGTCMILCSEVIT